MILIVGATGLFGSATVRQLARTFDLFVREHVALFRGA